GNHWLSLAPTGIISTAQFIDNIIYGRLELFQLTTDVVNLHGTLPSSLSIPVSAISSSALTNQVLSDLTLLTGSGTSLGYLPRSGPYQFGTFCGAISRLFLFAKALN